MESNRKRSRGFIKGKLIPLYRVAKSSSTVQYSSKVKPNQSSPSASSVGYVVHQDYLIAQPKPKVSFIVPAHDHSNNNNNREKLSQLENLYGVGDESVDIKAASYICSVQERFKLERTLTQKE